MNNTTIKSKLVAFVENYCKEGGTVRTSTILRAFPRNTRDSIAGALSDLAAEGRLSHPGHGRYGVPAPVPADTDPDLPIDPLGQMYLRPGSERWLLHNHGGGDCGSEA